MPQLVFVRLREARVVLAFLPIFGKGYTDAESKTQWFHDRAQTVMQDALELVSIQYPFGITMISM